MWKVSPKVRKQLKICKQKYKLWLASGKNDNILRTDNIFAKRELRKMLRNKKLTDRRNFYNDLMKNPSTDKFYQLVRQNKGGNRQNSGCLRVMKSTHQNCREMPLLIFTRTWRPQKIKAMMKLTWNLFGPSQDHQTDI